MQNGRVNQIQTFEKSHVTLKNLVCLINCKPDDIKLYFGERIGTMVVELKQNNEKLAQTKYFDHLLELAQLLYANKNSFHRKIPGCGMTLNVHIYDNSGRGKLESLLNEYQLETLNKCLQCFIEKNKNTLAAEEYLIDNKYVLALFTIARKLFVFDSEKKLNIIGIYIDQGLIIESDDSQISTLKEMANNYNWHRARTSASGIWHGDIEIGLDRDLENTEKLGQAREWINQNSEMLINFLTLLQENMIKFTLYSCSEKKGNNQEKSLDPITKVYNNGIC